MKKRKVLAVLLCAAMTAALAVGCGGSKGSDSSDKSSDSSSSSDDVITVGFSQVGAESDWRTANSQSMKDTFSKENGYDLIFDDAQQKQENQITAIRNFIQQEVDYILLAPVTETGWDTVLQHVVREVGYTLHRIRSFHQEHPEVLHVLYRKKLP